MPDQPVQPTAKEIAVNYAVTLPEDMIKIIAARATAAGFSSVDDYARHCLLRTAAPAAIDAGGDRHVQQLLGQHGALSEACDSLLHRFHDAHDSIDMQRLQSVIDRYWELRHDLEALSRPSDDGDISFEPASK